MIFGEKCEFKLLLEEYKEFITLKPIPNPTPKLDYIYFFT